MFWFLFAEISLSYGVYNIFGLYGLATLIVIAIWSVIGLESFNYMEHYGLERKEISPGVYEKVNLWHSWNASQRLTNYLLFKLQRHSDHHENAYKPYHTLLLSENSPILPFGYYSGALIALQPWNWKKIMNPLVIACNKKIRVTAEQEKANEKEVNKLIFLNLIIMTVILGCKLYF